MAGEADLDRQIAFLTEACKLRSVERASKLADGSRQENSGEHSWHLALFALVLEGEAPEGVRIDRVIRMALIHDLVEIDAGDAPIFEAGLDQAAIEAAEQAAADRIFGMLPEAQAAELRALWEEFEAAETPDARFAKALDRFQPPVLNLANGGASWTPFNVDYARVAARLQPPMERGAPSLWRWIGPRIRAFFERQDS
ncbi:HD domain-containing protein [Vannielia litorea]|uniref:Putative hydrolases of HD superfamily n=1 Tax=Vannielia litorea TaxID=1217970 RepID=A0A1N6F3N4_9RHOB|nr:HD domain-containing protein [Vannielia litorea]SIN89814.1 putative hydrolases of HD superfamily [Vannielia litorea]